MIVGRIDRLRVAPGLDDARILADQFSTRVVNKDRLFRPGDLLHPLAVAIVEIFADGNAALDDLNLLVLGLLTPRVGLFYADAHTLSRVPLFG